MAPESLRFALSREKLRDLGMLGDNVCIREML